MKFALIAISLLAGDVGMNASTITVGGTSVANQGLVSSVAGTTTVNFNGLSNGGPQNFTAGIASYSNLFIRTAVTTDLPNDSSPFANPTTAGGDLTITFSEPIVYFGFYWGSPDPLNTLTFFLDNAPELTVTGQAMHDQFGVPFGSGNGFYFNITGAPGESATKVVFSAAGSFPFETDNHAFISAVPEPRLSLFLVAGLAIVAAAQRRFKRPSTSSNRFFAVR